MLKNAYWRRRWLRASCRFAIACLLGDALAGCQTPDPSPAQADAHGGGPSAADACPSKGTGPSSACCPPGAVLDPKSFACVAVGPPECGGAADVDPGSCVPRWCWDWQDPQKQPCAVGSADCEPAARLCTTKELQEGRGCPAGDFPNSDTPGDCTHAGVFVGSGLPPEWNGEGATLMPPGEEEQAVAAGVPPLTVLADVDNTFFCRDESSGMVRFCKTSELSLCHRSATGSQPDSAQCQYVGVPWQSYCPPGFVTGGGDDVPGESLPGCTPDPGDCGPGEWAETPAGAKVWYVRAVGGSDSGPGTQAQPLAHIQKAIDLAGPGDAVAIASGSYVESLKLTRSITLAGRCAKLVQVYGTPAAAVLEVAPPALSAVVARVQGVALAGPVTGVTVQDGGTLQLDRVLVGPVAARGAYATGDGTHLQMRRSMIQFVSPDPLGQRGSGLVASAGAQVQLEDVRIYRAQTFAISVVGKGTALAASKVLIDSTLPQTADQLVGDGLVAGDGASVSLAQVRLSHNRDRGLFVSGGGTTLKASQVLVDSTFPQAADGKNGFGLSLHDGAAASLDRCRVTASRVAGVRVANASALPTNPGGPKLTATHLLVDGSQPHEKTGLAGLGIEVSHRGKADLEDVRLSGNRVIALSVDGTGTQVNAQHVLLDATQPEKASATAGVGAYAFSAAKLALRDARVTGQHAFGVVSADRAELDLLRTVIAETQSQASDQQGGVGIGAYTGSHVKARDVRVTANRAAGVLLVDAGTTLDAARVLVDSTREQKSDLGFGNSLALQSGAAVKLRSSRLLTGRMAGLQANAAKVDMAGVAVLDTQSMVSSGSMGCGLWVFNGSQAQVTSCLVRATRGAGIAINASASTIANSAIVNVDWGSIFQLVAAGATSVGELTTLADGIIVASGSAVRVEQSVVAQVRRAGVLAESSPDTQLAHNIVAATGGLFGLVLQHATGAVDQLNLVFGATTQNRATDAGLSVPAPPQPIGTGAIQQP